MIKCYIQLFIQIIHSDPDTFQFGNASSPIKFWDSVISREWKEFRGTCKGSKDEGTSEEKVQLLLLSYGNANEVGDRATDNGGSRQVERHHVNSFLPRSHLVLTFTD